MERRRIVLRFLVAVGCLLGIGCASAPSPAPAPVAKPPPVAEPSAPVQRPDYLTPPEILKRLEASKVSYRLDPKDSPPGGWADQLWPQQIESIEVPRVVVEDGRRVIRPWPENPKAEELIAQGEAHYRDRRYAEAAKSYEQALAVCPDCYLARAYLGDALLFSGDVAGALDHYQKALAINPDDYRLHYFQGSALARMGLLEEAREAFAWSLVLNPRNPMLRRFFRENRGVRMVLLGDVFVPRGFARREGEEVVVEFDPDYGAAWLAFANCKALWMGEPSHRQEMTGHAGHRFSSVEEKECLLSAAMAYAVQKKEGQQERVDTSLDRLMSVMRDGMVNELILFEMAARVHPQFTLMLDDEARQRLKKYVLRYVLLSLGGA